MAGLDFTNNFMRRLVARDGLFDAATGAPAPQSERLLRTALEAGSAQGLRSYSAGQFSPGAAGGANATIGYDGPARANPWDLVLALEGAVLFAGAGDPPAPGRTGDGRQLSVHRAPHGRRLGWHRRGRPIQRSCRVLGALVGPPRRM